MYLKKEPFVNKEVTKVCIDDFAMKKIKKVKHYDMEDMQKEKKYTE